MSRLKLTDYEISMKSGFVLEDPLTKLPPYFEPWNIIANTVVELTANNMLREEVLKMPVLDITRLNGQKEIKLGHLQLGIITACYLFHRGLDEAHMPKSLPKCLAIPLYGLYEMHDLPPVLTYGAAMLSNCIVKDSNRPVTDGNIATIYNIPGGESWTAFFNVHLEIEYAFAESMQAIQDVLDGVDESDHEKITRALEYIAEAVGNMKKAFTRIHEKLKLESFMGKLNIFFSGYDRYPLEDGLVLEGVTGPVKMTGADAGQTPTFKTLDALLGIEHQKDLQDHADSKLMYLYPGHRNFIYELRKRPLPLRAVVEKSKNTAMINAFDKVVQAIVEFRSYHIQVVTKYHFIGVNRLETGDGFQTIKSGNKFVRNYLKGVRDKTKQGTTST